MVACVSSRDFSPARPVVEGALTTESDFEDDEVSSVTTPLARTKSLLPTLAALAVAIWLLSSRFLNGYLVDALTELQWMAFTFLAPAALI